MQGPDATLAVRDVLQGAPFIDRVCKERTKIEVKSDENVADDNCTCCCLRVPQCSLSQVMFCARPIAQFDDYGASAMGCRFSVIGRWSHAAVSCPR